MSSASGRCGGEAYITARPEDISLRFGDLDLPSPFDLSSVVASSFPRLPTYLRDLPPDASVNSPAIAVTQLLPFAVAEMSVCVRVLLGTRSYA